MFMVDATASEQEEAPPARSHGGTAGVRTTYTSTDMRIREAAL